MILIAMHSTLTMDVADLNTVHCLSLVLEHLSIIQISKILCGFISFGSNLSDPSKKDCDVTFFLFFLFVSGISMDRYSSSDSVCCLASYNFYLSRAVFVQENFLGSVYFSLFL